MVFLFLSFFFFHSVTLIKFHYSTEIQIWPYLKFVSKHPVFYLVILYQERDKQTWTMHRKLFSLHACPHFTLAQAGHMWIHTSPCHVLHINRISWPECSAGCLSMNKSLINPNFWPSSSSKVCPKSSRWELATAGSMSWLAVWQWEKKPLPSLLSFPDLQSRVHPLSKKVLFV